MLTKFCAGMTVALSAAALMACGADDGDDDMSTQTGVGIGVTTGAANALGAPGMVPAPDGGASTAGTTGHVAATTDTLGASTVGGGTAGVGPMDAGKVSAWVAMKVDSFVSHWNIHAQLKCECYGLFDFPTAQACLAEEETIDEGEAECAKRVLSQDVGGADQFFDCALPAAESHTQCLQETFQCDQLETFQSCASPYDFASAGCLDRATSAREKLASCGLFQ